MFDLRNWRPLINPDLGFMNMFSDTIAKLEQRKPQAIPNIRAGDLLLVISDYSGEHDLADYQSLSFLFADFQRCQLWETMRLQLRQKHLSDGRRISFKTLRDKKKRNALPFLLATANTIPGLSATVLIHKDIENLFRESGSIDRSDSIFNDYQHWTVKSFEKMLRVVHLVSFFLAGLSRPHQNVIWITDEDEIAANDDRLRELTNLFATISSHYLSHNMGHFRCGTTKSDDGSRQLEDLASIPDLIAGALSEELVAAKKERLMPSNSLFVFRPKHLANKTVEIMDWFATDIQPLKRLVYVIDPVEGSSSLSLKHLRFHGSSDSDWI